MNETQPMGLFQRVIYALFVIIPVLAVVYLLLAIASANTVALLPSSASEFALSAYFYVPIYVVAFALAPWLRSRIPITRWL